MSASAQAPTSLRALSWNLFHGRDAPPDPALLTLRSRLLGSAERNATHAQVNRPLLREFAALIAHAEWDVALLQEAPWPWLRPLCRAAGAGGASALTSRNWGAALRSWIARRNPDLIASNEGGSNQLLFRPPWRLAETRRLTLSRLPERRRMLFVRLSGAGGELAVANLHATAGRRDRAAVEVEAAAERAVAWADGAPLVFGGDLNLRAARDAAVFERLRERFGLCCPTAPDAIDHLLVRDLTVEEEPRRLAPEARELVEDGLALRLSDHAPVTARFAVKVG